MEVTCGAAMRGSARAPRSSSYFVRERPGHDRREGVVGVAVGDGDLLGWRPVQTVVRGAREHGLGLEEGAPSVVGDDDRLGGIDREPRAGSEEAPVATGVLAAKGRRESASWTR
jgi:hypothetical protein